VAQLRVLHVISQLRRGGPLQALIAAKKQSRLPGIEHHIVSIKPADSRACAQAVQAGIAGTNAPDPTRWHDLLSGADIVQAHFWNSPEIHDFLAGELPSIRLLLWCHVNGGAAPHIIPANLLRRSDMVVVLTPSTLGLPAFRAADPSQITLVQSFADFTRLANCRPVAHDGFCVGYLGNVDFAKLHEAYVHMCANMNIPPVRFFICGDGSSVPDLRRQASELGILGRLEFHEYAEDIRPLLSQFDVFGYPLTANTSATAELSLQEAMYVGVPPVVFVY
jgi:glycosyltransferase involved in cell wall biosynthesis